MPCAWYNSDITVVRSCRVLPCCSPTHCYTTGPRWYSVELSRFEVTSFCGFFSLWRATVQRSDVRYCRLGHCWLSSRLKIPWWLSSRLKIQCVEFTTLCKTFIIRCRHFAVVKVCSALFSIGRVMLMLYFIIFLIFPIFYSDHYYAALSLGGGCIMCALHPGLCPAFT